MSLSRYTCVSTLMFLAACASRAPSKPTEVPPPVVQPSAESSPKAACVAVFQRQRECTSDFIPSLVALRVRLDVPPGIAAKDRDNHDALVAQAMEEWKADSTDEAIQATCDKLAGADPDGVARSNECLSASTCSAFVDCVMPVIESHLGRR